MPGVKVVSGRHGAQRHPCVGPGLLPGPSGIAEAFTYDASFVKLREVRLGYIKCPGALPTGWG